MTAKLLLSIMLVCCCIMAPAKTDKQAKAILDKTANTVKKAGDFEAQFTATSFKGTLEQARMNGVIYVHGTAYRMESENMVYWYDGNTLWNYVKANNEVNISLPPFYEQQAMNPYTFISLYRKGYEYDYGESELRGKACYCIHLRCVEKTQKIREMYLDIDKSTMLPLCIRFRRGADGWTRISVRDYKTNQKYPDSKFTFNKEDYPTAEIIDLR